MSDVYEKTYQYYLSQFNDINLMAIEQNLGVRLDKPDIIVPLFGSPYTVSSKGVTGAPGEKPALYICIILFKYLLMCPDVLPGKKEWASFKDLKDSGPLTAYFANDIERPLAAQFTGKLETLKNAGKAIGGCAADVQASYDLAMQFNALPQVPLLLLFNDGDDEFDASCSILFEDCAEQFLDPECLAMAAGHLLIKLKKAAGTAALN